jgi:hypothetical protein
MIRKLVSVNPARIGRFDGPPTCDAVPASLVDGTPDDRKADLIALLGPAQDLCLIERLGRTDWEPLRRGLKPDPQC